MPATSGPIRTLVQSILWCIAILCALAQDVRAADRAFLEIVPVTDGDSSGMFVPRQPGEGKTIVSGRFNDGAFTVADVGQLRLTGPDGEEIELFVDGDGIFREFGRIVSVRLAFELPASAAGQYALEWGDEVKGQNTVLTGVSPAAAAPAQVRTFKWRRGGQSVTNEEVTSARIEVIADTNADYYSLWYLVPVVLILVLLMIRKIATNDRRAPTAG